jgi:hypothetical protein
MAADPTEQPTPPLDESIQATKAETATIASQLDTLTGDFDYTRRQNFMAALQAAESDAYALENVPDKFPAGSTEQQAATLYIQFIRLQTKLGELEEQHKPYLAHQLAALAQDVSARFDWATILQYYAQVATPADAPKDPWDNGILANAISSTAPVRETLAHAHYGVLGSQPYGQLEATLTAIQSQIPEWESRGFLLAQPRDPGTETLPQLQTRAQELVTTIRHIVGVVSAYAELKRRYRDGIIRYNRTTHLLNQVVASLNEAGGYGFNANDSAYLDAVSNFLAAQVEQLSANGTYPATGSRHRAAMESLQAVPVESAVNAITLEGFHEQPGELLVVTESDLRQELGLLVPACFLAKIRLVVVTTRPTEAPKEDPHVVATTPTEVPQENPRIETIGWHNGEFDDQGNLVESVIELYRSPRVQNSANVHEQAYTRGEFLDTALHEVAHSIHSALGYVDMHDWETVVANDTTAVTWYVGHARKTNVDRGLFEDFAESFMLAVRNPAILGAKSPARYQYMLSLVAKYMGEPQKKIFLQEIAARIHKHADTVQQTRSYLTDLEKGANND